MPYSKKRDNTINSAARVTKTCTTTQNSVRRHDNRSPERNPAKIQNIIYPKHQETGLFPHWRLLDHEIRVRGSIFSGQFSSASYRVQQFIAQLAWFYWRCTAYHRGRLRRSSACHDTLESWWWNGILVVNKSHSRKDHWAALQDKVLSKFGGVVYSKKHSKWKQFESIVWRWRFGLWWLKNMRNTCRSTSIGSKYCIPQVDD